jgi:DNA topoisomerase-3
MKLYIAEKPSVGAAIAEVLGIVKKGKGFIQCKDNQVVTWCVGHLLELFSAADYDPTLKVWALESLPINPSVWKSKVSSGTKEQFNTVKGFLDKADLVYHAGDTDRAGAMIVDEVINFCNYKGKKVRLLINDLNAKSVRKALDNIKPHSLTYGMTKAAAARMRADWLVGINLTVAYTVKSKSESVISIGRVQTPVLSLIVQRDSDIENFKSKPFYSLTAELLSKQGGVNMGWMPILNDTDFDDNNRFIKKEKVLDIHSKIIKADNATVTSAEKKNKKYSPPSLFSLSTLQQAANKKFKYPIKEILDITQSLYQNKRVVTYPRTDCSYAPEDYHLDAANIIEVISKEHDYKNFEFDYSLKTKSFDDSKITAHHAIIPTGQKAQNLTEKEANIYKMICDQFVCQFMGDCLAEEIKVEVDFGIENSKFGAKGETILKKGFTSLTGLKSDSVLPPLNIGDTLQLKNLLVDTKKTTAPLNFTDSSLLAAMTGISKYVTDPDIKKILKETDGLGTEATRAEIVETIIKRGYVTRVKNSLVSTELGRAIVANIPKILTNPDTTALWEKILTDIEQDNMSVTDYLNGVVEYVNDILSELNNFNIDKKLVSTEKPTCPTCNKNYLNRIKGNDGFFWGCSGFKTEECKATFKDNKGKPVLSVPDKIICPKCNKNRLNKVEVKGKTPFWSCSGYFDKSCDATFKNKRGKPDI